MNNSENARRDAPTGDHRELVFKHGHSANSFVTLNRGFQRFDVARDPGLLGGGELGPDVAGEVGVGGLPAVRVRVAVDQVAELGDNQVYAFTVKLRNEF